MAVTCVALTSDESSVYSGSKDNAVIKHDIETGARTILKPHWSASSHSSSSAGGTNAGSGEVFAIAVSSDGKYCVSGGKDKIIRVYDARLKIPEIKTFTGHRDTVTALTFRHSSYTLFSGAMDRTLKHWDLNDMAYMETMFGHQEGILAMDCGSKNKPVTVGGDRTARVWSIEEENHTLFRTKTTSLDCVQYLNDDEFATGGQDGSINIWRSSMKKPILFAQKTHGIESLSPRWVCSLASLKMSNLLLSGSYDGTIKFWDLAIDSVNYRNSSMHVAYELPVPGFINSLQVSASGRLLVAGIGKEHKMGRWWHIKEAKNQVIVARLPDQTF